MRCRPSLLLRFLALLWLLLVTNVLVASPSGGYDARTRVDGTYDTASLPTFDYDSALASPANENKKRVEGCGGIIARFAEFPAAEGTANLTTAELKQLYPRVTPRRGLAEEVWERSKAPNGKVYDPTGVEIKPGDYWELGHTPGNQIPDARLRAAQEGWDRATWRQYQNDPDIYRPELKPTNRSHAHESDW
jgi:hypothetical protein